MLEALFIAKSATRELVVVAGAREYPLSPDGLMEWCCLQYPGREFSRLQQLKFYFVRAEF